MLLVSRALIDRLKLSPVPAYKLARRAGCHPSTLSKLLYGAERVKPADSRILAVGRALGLSPEECFVEIQEELKPAQAVESAA